MGPKAGGHPTGPLADAIKNELGGFDKFKEDFAKAATTRFGSGWAWLWSGPAASWSWKAPPTRTAR